MESKALKVFRRKMVNPLYWRKANRVFLGYTETDLASVERTTQLIQELSSVMDVPLTVEEQTQAAKWLVKQGIDPQSRRERLRIWKKAK